MRLICSTDRWRLWYWDRPIKSHTHYAHCLTNRVQIKNISGSKLKNYMIYIRKCVSSCMYQNSELVQAVKAQVCMFVSITGCMLYKDLQHNQLRKKNPRSATVTSCGQPMTPRGREKRHKAVFNRDHMSRFMTKPTKWLCAQRSLRSA